MGNRFHIVMSRVGLTVLHKFISPFLKRKDNHRLWNCLHLDLKKWAHRLNLIFPQSVRGHAEPMQPPRVSRSVCVCVFEGKRRECVWDAELNVSTEDCACVWAEVRGQGDFDVIQQFGFLHMKKKNSRIEQGRKEEERWQNEHGGRKDLKESRNKRQKKELFLILQLAELALQSLLFTWDQHYGVT